MPRRRNDPSEPQLKVKLDLHSIGRRVIEEVFQGLCRRQKGGGKSAVHGLDAADRAIIGGAGRLGQSPAEDSRGRQSQDTVARQVPLGDEADHGYIDRAGY